MPYEPKTVAEQAAFEFGQRIHQLRLGINAENLIARKYAFTHQYQFQRATDGYGRALAAFCAGAGLDLNEV